MIEQCSARPFKSSCGCFSRKSRPVGWAPPYTTAEIDLWDRRHEHLRAGELLFPLHI